MTLYEYRMLDEDAQWDAVWAYGKFLDIHLSHDIKYVLNAIDRYFVEVKWDIQTDKIVRKGVFIHGESLDKYSNISKLF